MRFLNDTTHSIGIRCLGCLKNVETVAANQEYEQLLRNTTEWLLVPSRAPFIVCLNLMARFSGPVGFYILSCSRSIAPQRAPLHYR